MAALQMALARRIPAAGLAHHSDHSRQCASQDYNDLLKARGISISMFVSAKGQPHLNIGHACPPYSGSNVGSVNHHHHHQRA